MKIKTISDLRSAYPALVSKLEDEILIKLGIVDSDAKEVMSLSEDEKKEIRRKAKHLAGL